MHYVSSIWGTYHWEGDTIVGSERNVQILNHTERKTGFILLNKLLKSTSEETRIVTAQRFSKLPRKRRLSVTYDNGATFFEYEKLERDLKLDVYFAHPYHSWERGTNENTNGLIRQFFPKKSSFVTISPKELKKVERLLNRRPRKRLGYSTPLETFHSKNVAL